MMTGLFCLSRTRGLSLRRSAKGCVFGCTCGEGGYADCRGICVVKEYKDAACL